MNTKNFVNKVNYVLPNPKGGSEVDTDNLKKLVPDANGEAQE